MVRDIDSKPRVTVESALAAHLASYGLDRAAYGADRFVVRLGPLRLRFSNPRYLPFHDLHHVALDTPPTFWGEVEVSALELRSGCPTWLIWFLCVASLAVAALVGPRRVFRALRRYAGCRNVYTGYE